MLTINRWFAPASSQYPQVQGPPAPAGADELALAEPCCPAAGQDVVDVDFLDPPRPTEITFPSSDPRAKVVDLEGYRQAREARHADPFARPRFSPGQQSVALARHFRNWPSQNLVGHLPRFQAAGGNNKNCADFVSSILQDTGRLKGHYVGVPELEQALRHQGWRRVAGAQAQPGDVWITRVPTWHTELVTRSGGTRTIGSNNNGQAYQTITERTKDPTRGFYYTQSRQ